MRNQNTEWSSIEIKTYRTKNRTLRNTTGKGRDVRLWRQRKSDKKDMRRTSKSIAGNAKPAGDTMNEYRIMVNSIEGSRHLEDKDRKLAGMRWHWIDDHVEKGV